MRSNMARWLVAATLLMVTAVAALAAGRGWLGVSTQPTDAELRRTLDLTRDGLLVNQVDADSPADRAGLRKGDVILTYNSRCVSTPADLRDLVRGTEPGRSASLGISRDGARRALQISVGELPDTEGDDGERFDTPVPPRAPSAPEAPRAPRVPRAPRDRGDGDVHRRVIIDGREVPEDEIDDRLEDLHIHLDGLDGLQSLKQLKGLAGLKDLKMMRSFGDSGDFFFAPQASRGRLGVRIEKLNDDMAQALGASGDKGVLVVEVLGDTPAQKAGIRAGDVIVRVGDDDVDDPEALVRALSDREGKVDIVLLRRGARRTIQAELQSRSEAYSELRAQLRGVPSPGEMLRIPEPGQGNRVYRWKAKHDAGQDDADLRQELQDLKRELRELREELRAKK